CIDPDFKFNIPSGHPGIFPSCGMICWGSPIAPGSVPPSSPTWDRTDPNNYIDCVAYGAYTGPTPTGYTSANSSTPGGGTMSLTRNADAPFDSTKFALATPSPQNNGGMAGAFTGSTCPPTTTTSTTTPTGPTTTTTSTTTPTGPTTTTTSTTTPTGPTTTTTTPAH